MILLTPLAIMYLFGCQNEQKKQQKTPVVSEAVTIPQIGI